MVAFIGVGVLNVTIALMVLGIPPILTNTFVGVRQVDRGAVEAARGVGMTELEVIRRGRAAARGADDHERRAHRRRSTIVATATIAPLAGVLTLGDFIINRGVYGEEGVLAGAILVALLALAFELVLAGRPAAADAARAASSSAKRRAARPHRIAADREIPRQSHPRGRITPTMSTHARLRGAVRLARRARARARRRRLRRRRRDDSAETSTTEASSTRSRRTPTTTAISLTVGSKNFTEQIILGEIYAQALEAAGYDVSTDLNLGDEFVALKALENGEISGYPEYTSTALTSFFDTAPEDVPGRSAGGPRPGAGRLREPRAWSPTRRRRSRSANAVGMLAANAEELGITLDLRPRGPSGPDPLRLARVPPADRLPGRARGVLRAHRPA